MVRIRDADVRRRVCLDIGDDIVIDAAIIRIETKIDFDIGVKRLKICDRLFIYTGLIDVGIVLCPEGDLVIAGGVKLLRHFKSKGWRQDYSKKYVNMRQNWIFPMLRQLVAETEQNFFTSRWECKRAEEYRMEYMSLGASLRNMMRLF